MGRRASRGVDFLSEGDILVRGTLDPVEALRIFSYEADSGYDLFEPDAMRGAVPEPTPKAIDHLRGRLYAMLENARPGYYRKAHCLPSFWGYDDGLSWMLIPAKGRGPGAFEAVVFE